MNGLDKITARIEQDSQKEIDALLDQARAEAAKIAGEYAEQAKAEAEKILTRGKQAAAQREERLASVSQLDCRKAQLAARQEMLDEAFEAARKKLVTMPPEEYVDLLAGLVVKASTTGRETVIFSPRDRDTVGRAVVASANERLAKAAAPDLPPAGSKVGAAINKVVTGASAVLKGTAMLTLSEETRPMDGGFILSSGNVEVNCTFATLVRLQRSELAGQVAGVLFE